MLAVQFAVLGIGVGAVYALLGQGVVAVYRGSGVLNFGHGAILMMSAFVFADLRRLAWPVWPAAIIAVLVSLVLGALIHLVVMRRLRDASGVSRAVATLGILLTLEGLANLIWGETTRTVPSYLPTGVLTLGDVAVGIDKVIILGITVAITAALWALYRFTLFGLATQAVAENRRGAAALGWSPDRVSTVNWVLGAGLAGVAGVLLAPIGGIQIALTSLLVIPALATALLGGFTSFPRTFLAGVLLGVGESEIQQYVNIQGAQQALPFLVIVVYLVARGSSLPTRGYVSERFAVLGSGRVQWRLLVPAVAVLGFLVMNVFSQPLNDALSVTFLAAIIVLSVVVLTGYTGQLSLAQYTLAGFGALIAGHLVHSWHWPFEIAIVSAAVCTVVIGLVFAVPTLRIRGVHLAVVTLGLGMTVQSVIFNNGEYTGRGSGLMVGGQTFLGIDVDPLLHPERYALLALGAFLACALAVTSIRRSRTGRRLVAVRTNERAAAALGISVFESKLYAFALAAGLAAIGGALLGFQQYTVTFLEFDPMKSILVIAYAVIGSVAFVSGAPLAGQMVAGGLGAYLLGLVVDGVEDWLPLIGGALLLLLMVQEPNGLAHSNAHMAHRVLGLVRRPRPRAAASPGRAPMPAPAARTVEPKLLRVEGLRVQFGGVVAVDGLGFTVEPGQIRGLIGPNGAGKTTVIDAITGFVQPAAGTITLDDRSILRLSAARRARAGITRSFQSLELFDDLTLLENLQAASDPRDRRAYLTNLVHPGNRPLPAAAVAATQEFGLAGDLDKRPAELPYGLRRLVAVARSVATEPSILLLDEPAAGLDEHESEELAHLVRRLASSWGIGVLLVEHDMSFVMSVCDRITVMEFGRPIAEGTPAEIQRDPAVVAAYLGDQSGGDEPELVPSGAGEQG